MCILDFVYIYSGRFNEFLTQKCMLASLDVEMMEAGENGPWHNGRFICQVPSYKAIKSLFQKFTGSYMANIQLQ